MKTVHQPAQNSSGCLVSTYFCETTEKKLQVFQQTTKEYSPAKFLSQSTVSMRTKL